MKQLFHLPDVVEVEVLQEIQDKYAEATRLAAVIVDDRGKPVTRYSRFTHFCQHMRCSPGREGCERSDARGGLEAMFRNKPFIYRCHAGLVDLAAPIVVNGQYLGSILSGQVVLQEQEMGTLEQPVEPGYTANPGSNMQRMYEDIPVVPRDQVEAAAQLMYVVANYIVEKGVGSIVQEQLAETNLRIMEEEQTRAELEKALKESELKALQSQINPHFLFNTLNTISRLALLEGAGKTQKVAFALSELLRYSLRRIDGVVTLKEELDHVHRYLLIQQVRFGDRIQSDIQVEPAALALELPLLTLQPLVENAVNHGLEPRVEGGVLTIGAEANETGVHLTIADNGEGMSRGRVREIQEWIRDSTAIPQDGNIGIVNVHRRLQHFFGESYYFRLQATPGKGTRVDLRLPWTNGKRFDRVSGVI